MAHQTHDRGGPRTAPAPMSAGGIVAEAVQAQRRHLTLSALADRLGLAGAAAGLLPLLVVIGDHFMARGLPRVILGTALLAWLLSLLAALIGLPAVALARRLSPLHVARHIERLRGIRYSSLVNALLLMDSGRERYAASAALRQAARDVASHRDIAADRPRRRHSPELALLAVAAAWLLYSAVAVKPIGPSLARFLGSDLMAPTATRLELTRPAPGDVVHAGEPLVIEFAVHGRAVSAVSLDILAPERPSAVRTYTSSASVAAERDLRRFSLPPIEVQEDIHYRCTAGDAVLAGVIPVLPLPDIEALEITLQPPEYTGRGPYSADGPDLDVLVGTRATFRLRANGPLVEPVFVLDGEHETRTRMRVTDESPEVATLTLRPRHSGLYRIEFSDAWGSPYRGPREHRLDVRPDQPPTVIVTSPAAGELPDDIVNIARYGELTALAKDDVGLTRLEFVTEAGPGGRPATRRSDFLSGDDAARPRIEARVPLSEITLAPGESLRAWFEATDGRVLLDGRAAPQSVRGRVVTLVNDPTPEPPEPAPESDEAAEPEHADQPEEQPTDDSAARPTEPSDDEPDVEESAQPVDDDVATPPSEPRAEPPASQPSPARRGRDKAASQPTSRPAASSQPGREPGEAAAGGFERELEEFVRKHGGEAKEAARRARGGSAGQPDGEPGRTPAPVGRDAEENEGSDGDSSPEAQPPGSSASADGEDGKTSGAASGEAGKPGSGEGESEVGAAGAEDGQSQGDAGGGASSGSDDASADGEAAEGGERGQPEPASQPAEPGDQPAAGALPESGGVVETIDLLEMIERGEELDADALVEAGWSPQQAAAFVKALERLHAAARQAGGVSALRQALLDARMGDDRVHPGRGLSGAVQRGTETVEGRADRLRRITPPAEQDVPEDIQELLEAYYRALATGAARAGE